MDSQRTGNKPDEPTAFAEFYTAYPRKAARPIAAKAYTKALKRASHEEIMAGLDRAKTVWHRSGTTIEYTPLPSKWLNGDRWNDEDTSSDKPNGLTVEEGYGYGII